MIGADGIAKATNFCLEGSIKKDNYYYPYTSYSLLTIPRASRNFRMWPM